MNNSTLKNLLIEYDKKRMQAEIIADRNKAKLYEEYPELDEIDKKINSIAISTMKDITKNNDPKLLENLNEQINSLRKEKNDLLKSIGSKANNIYPNYECNKCKDTGYIDIDGQTQMCSCLKQKIYDIEYNKSNMNSLDKQNFENFKLDFYSDKPNPEKYNTDISPRENMEIILDICHEFIDNFDNPERKNLFFTGKTGLGKTFLSSSIANELLKNGKTVLYQTAPVMLDTIISYRFGKDNVSNDIYDNLLNVDLLIIDDLGTEGTNQMKLEELFTIINARILNNRKITKTIISSNLSLQTIFQNYDERLGSRIVGNYDICYFFGDDIRFLNR